MDDAYVAANLSSSVENQRRPAPSDQGEKGTGTGKDSELGAVRNESEEETGRGIDGGHSYYKAFPTLGSHSHMALSDDGDA